MLLVTKGAKKAPPVTQIIMAALNEEVGVELTIAELRTNVNPQKVLVVDGNSCDRTVEVAKNMGAEVIYQDGIGKGDAIAKAVEYLDSTTAVDYVVFIDADYTYPSDHVPHMIQILEKNPQIGMVTGNRFETHTTGKAMRKIFYFGNKLIALTYNLFNGIYLNDPLTGLRVVRAKILKGWIVKSKSFDIEVEINSLVKRKGFRIIEVPIDYRVRVGEKKLKILHGAVILKRIMFETTGS